MSPDLSTQDPNWPEMTISWILLCSAWWAVTAPACASLLVVQDPTRASCDRKLPSWPMLPPKCRQCPEGAGCGHVSTDSLLLPQLSFSYTPQMAQLTTLILSLQMCSVQKCREQLSSLKWENVKGIVSRSAMPLPSACHRLFFKIAWENYLKEWKPFRLLSWLASLPPTSILRYPCFYQLICLQISWIENREKTLNLWTISSSQMVQW